MSDMRAEFMRRIDGLFVGMLTEQEQRDFADCVEQGYATREYKGAAGFMGLAKAPWTGRDPEA